MAKETQIKARAEDDDDGVKGEADSEGNKKAKPRSKQTEASSPLLSQQDTPAEVLCNPISSQSTRRTEVVSVGGAKSLQGPEPADRDLLVAGSHREDTQSLTEEKPKWGEIISTAASLLPAVGIAGAAMGVLSEAGTRNRVSSLTLHPPKHPAESSNSQSRAPLCNLPFPQHCHILLQIHKKKAQRKMFRSIRMKFRMKKVTIHLRGGENDVECSQSEGKNSGAEVETFQQEHEEDEETYKDHVRKKGKIRRVEVMWRTKKQRRREVKKVRVFLLRMRKNKIMKLQRKIEEETAPSIEEEEEGSEKAGGEGSEFEESVASEEEGSDSEEEDNEEESEVSEDEEDESGEESGSSESREEEPGEENKVDEEEEGETEDQKDLSESEKQDDASVQEEEEDEEDQDEKSDGDEEVTEDEEEESKEE
ncbi:hypothetical protein F7725_001957, partial [Dissostichus mawsoni]